MDKAAIIQRLNRVLELELAGVARYTHYVLIVYGVNRIPVVKWLEKPTKEVLQHAREAGKLITYLGGHPSLAIGPLLETYRHAIEEILKESLEHKLKTFEGYEALLEMVKDKNPRLEEGRLSLMEVLPCLPFFKGLRKTYA